MPKFLTEPVPHEEGAEAIAGKPAVTRRIFDQLAPELQARAFVITGVEALDCVARVRDMIAELPLGGDFREIKDKILAEMSPWLVDPAADDDERAKQMAAANRRAEMLLRMHGWQAYARTQYEINEAHKDVFPFRQYLSSEDSRVRPHHEALNKKILPADHPFWLNHTPPWEFNCRCDCVVMTADEAEEIRAGETNKAPENKLVLPEEQLREIEQQKRIVKPGGQGFLDIRTPRERDGKGYEWRPADDLLSIDQILDRYPPDQRKQFEDFADRQRLSDGRSLLQWWKRQPGGPAHPPTVKAKTAKPSPVPGPAPAGVARTLDAVQRGLDAMLPDYHTSEQAIRSAQDATKAAAQAYINRGHGSDPAALMAHLDETRVKLQELRDEHAKLVERTRDVVSIPAAERGAVTIASRSRKSPIHAHVQAGADLTARYTSKKLLPSIQVKALRGGRAYHSGGTVHVNTNTSLSVVMHEITHATEQQTPAVLKAANDFLAKRAGGQPTKSLRVLTGHNYKAHERAWEDEWVSRGGSLYSGKDYGGRATEILTMGIERLHADPVLFRRTDPEYCDFVIKTLQEL